jgi:hypothetical protein
MKQLLAISLTTLAVIALALLSTAAPAGAWQFEGLSAPEKVQPGILQAEANTLAGPTACNYGFDPCFGGSLDLYVTLPPPIGLFALGTSKAPTSTNGGLNSVHWIVSGTCATTPAGGTLLYTSVFSQKFHDQGPIIATESWTAQAWHTCP